MGSVRVCWTRVWTQRVLMFGTVTSVQELWGSYSVHGGGMFASDATAASGHSWWTSAPNYGTGNGVNEQLAWASNLAHASDHWSSSGVPTKTKLYDIPCRMETSAKRMQSA